MLTEVKKILECQLKTKRKEKTLCNLCSKIYNKQNIKQEWGSSRRKQSKKKQQKMLYVWSLQKSTWMFQSNIEQMKPKLSCSEWTYNTVCLERERKKKTRHTSIKTSSYLWSMVEGGIMIWGCFAVSGPGQIVIINSKINYQVYWSSTKDGWCNRERKQTDVQKKINNRTATEENMPPDLNPIEMPWHDLKKSYSHQIFKNIAERKQFCKEECSKFFPDYCQICNYRKYLFEVIP